MRPRIQHIDTRLANKYRQLGLTPSEAWAKVKQIEFHSEMRYAVRK